MKILIIRFSSIGDIVLTTPIIRTARQQLGAEIHFLTKNLYKDLLLDNPNIEKVLVLKNNLQELIPQIKSENYDEILDLHNNLRTKLLQLRLQRKFKAFYKANIEKWLMVNFKRNFLPKEHIVNRYFKTIEHLGVINDKKGLDFYYKKDPDLLYKLDLNGSFLVLAIGGAHKTKRMPSDLLENILKNVQTEVVLIGGRDVVNLGNELERKFKHVRNLCGEMTIAESAQIIDSAQGLISGDTGMMHIGAALKKPMVSVWGNTIPGFGMSPYYGDEKVNNKIIEVELNCRPCSKTGHSKCPRGHFDCMKKIDSDEILNSLRTLI